VLCKSLSLSLGVPRYALSMVAAPIPVAPGADPPSVPRRAFHRRVAKAASVSQLPVGEGEDWGGKRVRVGA